MTSETVIEEYKKYLKNYLKSSNDYNYYYPFFEGLAIVEKKYPDTGKVVFGAIDKNFNEVIPCVYDKLENFQEGLAYFQKDEKTGFIDKDENVVFYIYGGFEKGFNNGYAVLRDYNSYDKYMLVDKKGQVTNISLEQAENYPEKVYPPSEYTLSELGNSIIIFKGTEKIKILENCKVLSPLSDGYALIMKDFSILGTTGEKGYIDCFGNFYPLKKEKCMDYLDMLAKPNGSRFMGLKRLTDLYDFGSVIFCKSNNNDFYFYNKYMKSYEKLDVSIWDAEKLQFTKDFLRIGNKKYIFNSYGFVDVSLLDYDYLYFKEGINPDNILGLETFEYKLRKNPDFVDIDKKAMQEAKHKIELEEAVKKDEERIVKEQTEKEENIKRISELTEELQDLANKTQNYSEISINFTKKLQISPEYLFVELEDHFIINGSFKDKLKYFDLSGISFKNVDVSGIDFSDTDAFINPQEVYKKDLSNAKFKGINFNGTDFKDINICGTDFTDSIMDFTKNVDLAIKDDQTILNGGIIR